MLLDAILQRGASLQQVDHLLIFPAAPANQDQPRHRLGPVPLRHRAPEVEQQKVILEFDGRAKYFQYAPTEEVVFEERRREKAMQAQGWKVVRIEWDDLSRPWDVDRKLREALDLRVERRKPAVPLLGSNGTAG